MKDGDKISKKRGQFWYSDYLIGIMVFMVIGFLFFRTFVDVSTSNSLMENLIDDGISISNSFMSSGYLPDYWDDAVPDGRIGFVDNGKLNIDFYQNFTNLIVQGDYEKSKYLIGTRYDYIVYFEDENGNPIENNGILMVLGKYSSLTELNNANADAIVKIIRFVWVDEYETPIANPNDKGRILRMVVIVWK
ncbi:MAG: hypothetical protein V1663_03410 [archaeon]